MIFGVDLGTRRIALAAPDAGFTWALSLESARLRREFASEVDAGVEMGAQASIVVGQLYGYTGHHFFAERPLLGRPHSNVKTAVGQGLSAGAALSQLPGDVHLLEHPSLWKKATCGHGNASKDDVRGWLEGDQPTLAALCGEDQDLIDATCLGLYGLAVMAQAGQL